MEQHKEKEKIAESSTNKVSCADRDCPVHGCLKVRGREFKGTVIKKFPRRLTIEFERIIPARKYERYYTRKSRIHARLPDCLVNEINVGDYILIRECRPLSKILHFVAIKKVSKEKKEKTK
jgi:small subunit ribosomal protein S17